jgi:hypothetical protein
MGTSSQQKKSSSHKSRSKRKDQIVSVLLERNDWNPFERVDPKILEMLHRKHSGGNAEKARKYYLLTEETEDAPI